MKFIVILIVAFCSSCSLIDDLTNSNQGWKSLHFSTIEQAVDWVHFHISYETAGDQYGRNSYIASPDEVYNSGKGDCKGHSILAMAILNNCFGLKPDFIETDNKTHAVIYVPTIRKYVDTESSQYYSTIEVDDRYDYDYIMTLAKTTHGF